MAQRRRNKKPQFGNEPVYTRQDAINQSFTLGLKQYAEDADRCETEVLGRLGPFAFIHEQQVSVQLYGQGDGLHLTRIQIGWHAKISGV